MITPQLEKLIWQGKAFFKTYNAGPQKSTLNIDNDRFIIITDITFSGYNINDTDPDINFTNIQLAIYGEKGFNSYIFRNRNMNLIPIVKSGGVDLAPAYQITQPKTIHTYLLHTTQVGFSFMGNNVLSDIVIATFDEPNPSYDPPLDYGKKGDKTAIPVVINATDSSTEMDMYFQNVQDPSVHTGNVSVNQIQYPANVANLPDAGGSEYCVATINYVEIIGQPENIQF